MESLFNDYSHAFNRSAGLFNKVDKAESGIAVGKKIVDNKHAVIGFEILLVHRDVIVNVLGEGIDLSAVFAVTQILVIAFFGKNNRHSKKLRRGTSYSYA